MPLSSAARAVRADADDPPVTAGRIARADPGCQRRWRTRVIPIDSPASAIASLTILTSTRSTRAVLQEQRLADMVGDRLDQREMHARRQRGGRGVLQVEIVLRRRQRRIGREMRRGRRDRPSARCAAAAAGASPPNRCRSAPGPRDRGPRAEDCLPWRAACSSAHARSADRIADCVRRGAAAMRRAPSVPD